MLSSLFIPLLLMPAQPAQPAIVQKSSGWCSPNIANVAGNVTLNCIGVDPRALKRLNAELSRKIPVPFAAEISIDWTAASIALGDE